MGFIMFVLVDGVRSTRRRWIRMVSRDEFRLGCGDMCELLLYLRSEGVWWCYCVHASFNVVCVELNSMSFFLHT
jgi:hypothetical protein